METTFKNILNGVVGVSIALGLGSCAAESPFENVEEPGGVRLHTVISNVTTRAISNDYAQQLRKNRMVYISRTNGENPGLVYKHRGLDDIENVIVLKPGNYAAEAWAGDSVAASLSSKFFRGYQLFEVSSGAVTHVSINCPIKNTLVVIEKVSLLEGKISELMEDDFTITVSNKHDNVVFNKENLQETGYFMLSDADYNSETQHYELSYKLEGTRKVGKKHFTISGIIPDVKSGYRYSIKFGFDENYKDPDLEPTGASSPITIEIDEKEASSEETSVYPSEPTITWVTEGTQDALDFRSETEIPEELALMVCAVGEGFNSINMTGSSPNAFSIAFLTDDGMANAKTIGIDFVASSYTESTNTSTSFILFKKSFFQKLTAGNTSIIITAQDKSGKETKKEITITI